MGSVGCLKNIKHAISVARSVMEHTQETLLVGDDGGCSFTLSHDLRNHAGWSCDNHMIIT